MGKNKIHYSDDFLAREAYAVLIRKERASRSVTRAELKAHLASPSIYQDFLKICLEQDGRGQLEIPAGFKKGVYLVLQSIGISKVERNMGLSRVTLYRMFSDDGNPSLSTFMKVLRYLGLRLWVVDSDFIKRGQPFSRLKDERFDGTLPERLPGVILDRGTRKGPKTWSYIEPK